MTHNELIEGVLKAFDEKFSGEDSLSRALATNVYDIPSGEIKTRREFIHDFLRSQLQTLVGEVEANGRKQAVEYIRKNADSVDVEAGFNTGDFEKLLLSALTNKE